MLHPSPVVFGDASFKVPYCCAILASVQKYKTLSQMQFEDQQIPTMGSLEQIYNVLQVVEYKLYFSTGGKTCVNLLRSDFCVQSE